MRNLHDLPTEIVDLIFDHLQLKDLDLVGASCQRFRILAEPHKSKHRFSTIEVGCRYGRKRYPNVQPPLHILCWALTDPRMRRYAKRLGFYRCASEYCLKFHMRDFSASSSESAILKSIYGEDGESDEFYQELLAGNQDFVFPLLLMLLTNAHEVVLNDWPGIITKTAIGRPSNQLFHVSKVTMSGEYDSSIFTTFAQLPSVRVLEGTNIPQNEDEFIMDQSSCKSNVHSICIDNGKISPESFSPFLSAFKNLRKFIYTAANGNILQPSAIVAALLEHASSSLEVLEIMSGRSPFITSRTLFIGSLQPFKRLRHVGVDFEMLLLDGLAQKLVNVLPASVETVDLRHHLWFSPGWPKLTGSGFIAYLLSDLPELKEDLLPNLRKIISSKPIKRFFKVPLEEAGIVVEAPYCCEK